MSTTPSCRRPAARWHRVAIVAVVVVVALAAPIPAAADDAVAYVPPVDAPVVDPFRAPISRYGAGNRGLTYDLAPGTTVSASAGGTVVFAGPVAGTLHVTVQHPDGLRTSYSFLESVGVRVGQRLGQGDPVGTGGTGLHFGVRQGTEYLDPEAVFASVTVRVRLVPVVEPVRPTPASLRAEHEILRALVAEERPGLLDRLRDAWDVAYGTGAAVVGEVWDTALLLDQLLSDLRPLEVIGDVVVTLWERYHAECTPSGVADAATDDGAGTPAAERRVALLVAGLGSSSEHGSIDDLDVDTLGYVMGDVVRFSYEGGRAPAGPGEAIAADLAALPATSYEPEATNSDIRAQGVALADLIEQAAAAAPDATIDLYAHSLGGLVTRVALLELAERPGGLDVLGQVVTMGTPHSGADLATLAAAAGDVAHLVADGASVLLDLGIDADGTSVRQMAEHSDLIAELRDAGVPDGVDFRTISARGDMVVTADKADVAGHPRAVVDLLGPLAHGDLPGDPAVTRELALGLAGLPPACESFANAVFDTIIPETVSVATDALSLHLLLGPSGRRGPRAPGPRRPNPTVSDG